MIRENSCFRSQRCERSSHAPFVAIHKSVLDCQVEDHAEQDRTDDHCPENVVAEITDELAVERAVKEDRPAGSEKKHADKCRDKSHRPETGKTTRIHPDPGISHQPVPKTIGQVRVDEVYEKPKDAHWRPRAIHISRDISDAKTPGSCGTPQNSTDYRKSRCRAQGNAGNIPMDLVEGDEHQSIEDRSRRDPGQSLFLSPDPDEFMHTVLWMSRQKRTTFLIRDSDESD